MCTWARRGRILLSSLHHRAASPLASNVHGLDGSCFPVPKTFAANFGKNTNRFNAYFLSELSRKLSGVLDTMMRRGESQNCRIIPRAVNAFPDPVLCSTNRPLWPCNSRWVRVAKRPASSKTTRWCGPSVGGEHVLLPLLCASMILSRGFLRRWARPVYTHDEGSVQSTTRRPLQSGGGSAIDASSSRLCSRSLDVPRRVTGRFSTSVAAYFGKECSTPSSSTYLTRTDRAFFVVVVVVDVVVVVMPICRDFFLSCHHHRRFRMFRRFRRAEPKTSPLENVSGFFERTNETAWLADIPQYSTRKAAQHDADREIPA